MIVAMLSDFVGMLPLMGFKSFKRGLTGETDAACTICAIRTQHDVPADFSSYNEQNKSPRSAIAPVRCAPVLSSWTAFFKTKRLDFVV